METGRMQDMHRSRAKGKRFQTPCQQPQRAGSAGLPPPCTGLHPEEEEEERYRWQCCSAAIPSHRVALKTTDP